MSGADLGARLAAVVERGEQDVHAVELARQRSRSALFAEPSRGVTLGRYVLLERIGRGGMGVVYSAYDPELDRKVAIKIVAVGEEEGSRGRARWLREAQSLARLSHPNVVTVHDVGTIDDAVWIAMELVGGRTLGAWIAAERPHQAEIVDVLLRAGAGIAAAHHAGLVHRDIKPDNVMITRERDATRVLVMDFGLARATDLADPRTDARASMSGSGDSNDTMPGAIAGTPAYMAPEQHLGLGVDGRTDQFGFCVMAWEALYGERPFSGDSIAALALAVCEGQRRPAPSRAVPTAIRAALERGMASDPQARFAEMDELLAAIAHGGRRRRRRIAVAAVISGVGVAAVALGAPVQARRAALARCHEEAAAIAALWPGAAGREGLAAAFAATGSPIADSASTRVADRLDDWTDRFRATADAACVAEVEGTRDDTDVRRARECLGEREGAAKMLLDVFTEARSADVIRAVGAVAALETPESCADDTVLRARVDPPEGTDMDAIAAVRRELDRVAVLRGTGRHEAARHEAETLLERAEQIAWPPLVTEAKYEAAVAIDEAGDAVAAEPMLIAVYMEALASGRDRLAIDAAHQLTFVVGYELRRIDEGLLWGRHGEGLAARTHTDELQAAQLSSAIATVLLDRGEASASLARQEEVHRVFVASFGSEHPRIAAVLSNIALAESQLGDQVAAEAHYREALALSESVLGADHPDTASVINDVAVTQATRGDMRGALPLFERVLAIRERALGPDHPLVAAALNNLAGVRSVLGEGPAAEPLLRRAVAILEAALGPDHPDLAAPLCTLAGLLRDRGALDEAETALRRALVVRETAFGPAHASVGEPLAGLAAIELARGRAREAIALAERALELQRDAPPLVIGESRFLLARALDLAGDDRARALALARQALDDLADEQPPQHRREVEAWLRERTP